MMLTPEIAADLCALMGLATVIVILGRHDVGPASFPLMLGLMGVGVLLALL